MVRESNLLKDMDLADIYFFNEEDIGGGVSIEVPASTLLDPEQISDLAKENGFNMFTIYNYTESTIKTYKVDEGNLKH